MDAITRDLTEPQREAVCHVDGPMLILAGPGSGKTRVITHRIAHMLAEGVPEWQIAALTFTNKAASEMRERVQTLAPGRAVWLGTFHRFCAYLLRRYAPMVGLRENYSIYDTQDMKSAMKRAIEASGVSTDFASRDEIATAISRLKNRLVTPSMLEGMALSAEESVAARVYPVYRKQLLAANAVDFDDLLLHVAMLLREHPEVRRELDARFRHIMVDEYQDTNLAQYAIVRALSIDHPNLAVTGDPDQSIYGWRGADLNNILDFEKDYPTVHTVRLEQNYRSTPNILRIADRLIRHNRRRKAKGLFTENGEGDPVVVRVYEDGREEADGIVEAIADAIENEGARPRDFAIFCRMNYLTRSLEHAFRRFGLRYQIVNGLEFYQRKEVKDVLSYLHLINNPDHDVAFERVVNTPPRGIGAKTMQRLRGHADRRGLSLLEAARELDQIDGLGKRPASFLRRFVSLYDLLAAKATSSVEDIVKTVVHESGYEQYLDRLADSSDDVDRAGNVSELITAAVEFDRQYPDQGSLELFLEQTSLVADTDAFDGSDDHVTMMTLHAAKGLEFPRVFIIAVEDETLPHFRSKHSEHQVEEERRLLFVGITRAMRGLQLSFCKRRSNRGQAFPAIPSPFLNELPREDLRFVDPTSDRSAGPEDECFQDDGGYPDAWDLDEPSADETSYEADETSYEERSSDGAAEDDAVREVPQPATADAEEEFSTAAGARPGRDGRGWGGPPRVGSERVDSERVDSGGALSKTPEPRSRRKSTSDAEGGKRRTPPAKPAGLAPAGLTTAAKMLDSGAVSLAAYQPGLMVRHRQYGDGVILEVTGRGPKRTARIEFESGTVQFRLAFADLELIR